jgi:hypothetical protein
MIGGVWPSTLQKNNNNNNNKPIEQITLFLFDSLVRLPEDGSKYGPKHLATIQ